MKPFYTARQPSYGKVIFSLACVCLSTGVCVTITDEAMDLTVQVPQPPPPTSDMGPLQLHASDILYPSLETVQTCSFENPPLALTSSGCGSIHS